MIELEETRKLLRAHKLLLAQALARGERVPVAELATVSKLELRLANLEQFERLRRLTREPGCPEITSLAGS